MGYLYAAQIGSRPISLYECKQVLSANDIEGWNCLFMSFGQVRYAQSCVTESCLCNYCICMKVWLWIHYGMGKGTIPVSLAWQQGLWQFGMESEIIYRHYILYYPTISILYISFSVQSTTVDTECLCPSTECIWGSTDRHMASPLLQDYPTPVLITAIA